MHHVLAINIQIAGLYQALVEAFRLAQASGLDAATFFKALDLNVAKSGLSELKRSKLIADDWSTQFSVKHMHKDLRLALHLAAEHGLALPQTERLETAYTQAETLGFGDADFSALAETVRRPLRGTGT